MNDYTKLKQQLEVFVQKLLDYLKIDRSQIEIDFKEDRVSININTSKAPFLIGRHGQTIQALRRVISLFLLQQEFVGYVFLDINQYYHTKDGQLINRIAPLIQQAVETGRSVEVPGLTPRQRRVVHIYCAGLKEVDTQSVDTPNGRVLIIRPKTGWVNAKN